MCDQHDQTHDCWHVLIILHVICSSVFSAQDDEFELLPSGADAVAAADMPGASSAKRPVARCRALALAPTGRCWAAATTEGLLLYSADDNAMFDPTDLSEDLTPQSCHAALASQSYVRALLIALRLKDAELIKHVVLSTPPDALATVASALPRPAAYLPQLLGLISEALTASPHVEFLLRWVHALCTQHGELLKKADTTIMPVLRSLQKGLGRLHADLSEASEQNMYTLEYLTAVAAAGGDEDGDGDGDDQEAGGDDE